MRCGPLAAGGSTLTGAPAATQKWSKGKMKEKVNNLVLFDKVRRRPLKPRPMRKTGPTTPGITYRRHGGSATLIAAARAVSGGSVSKQGFPGANATARSAEGFSEGASGHARTPHDLVLCLVCSERAACPRTDRSQRSRQRSARVSLAAVPCSRHHAPGGQPWSYPRARWTRVGSRTDL